MEVGLLDRVVIDDRQPPDAGAAEILQHRAAEPAGADHQHRRRGEPRLPGRADLGQHRLAGVAVGHAATARRRDPGLRLRHRIGIVDDVADHRRRSRRPPARHSSARSSVSPPIATSGLSPISLFHSPMPLEPLRRKRHLLQRVG